MISLRKFFTRSPAPVSRAAGIAPALIDQMLAFPGLNEVAGEEAEISPVFVNMQSYVGIAESLSLRQLSQLMEAYFEVCGSEIALEGGTIDKFIGDSVVAMFGAPMRTSDHGLRACLAALKIQSRIARLRARLQREPQNWPEPVQRLRVRIGINTGTALVGAASGYTRF